MIGVDTLPVLPTDPGDRNRTSPFAFTGNRFEFRAPGSMQSVGGPMVTINTIMAEALDYIATDLETAVADGTDFDTAVQNLLTEIITNHGAVVFNGDGYSENWQIEAAERGLPNLKTTLDALPELISEDAMELFEKYKVFNHREMHSRYEIGLEQYALTVGVEAKLTLEIGTHQGAAGGGAVPDRAGAEPAGAAGRPASRRTPRSLDGVDPAGRPAGGARRAGQGAGRRPRRRPRWPRPSTPRTSCCRRWPRCVPPPTCSKASSPTTCGRCRPTRRCSTSCSRMMHYRQFSRFDSSEGRVHGGRGPLGVLGGPALQP